MAKESGLARKPKFLGLGLFRLCLDHRERYDAHRQEIRAGV
jgi:hypothetical protein